jgi:uncharacterized membrane protein
MTGLGVLHVAAAGTALVIGLAVLVRTKGTRSHVVAGRSYSVAMLAVTCAALLLYDATGRPGPFHVLAVISLLTLAAGWATAPGRRTRLADRSAHGTFMTWSFVGLASAGLAQAATAAWPDFSPWPVVAVVGATTLGGLLIIRRWVQQQ